MIRRLATALLMVTGFAWGGAALAVVQFADNPDKRDNIGGIADAPMESPIMSMGASGPAADLMDVTMTNPDMDVAAGFSSLSQLAGMCSKANNCDHMPVATLALMTFVDKSVSGASDPILETAIGAPPAPDSAAPVPEPNSLFILALGLLVIAFRKFR